MIENDPPLARGASLVENLRFLASKTDGEVGIARVPQSSLNQAADAIEAAEAKLAEVSEASRTIIARCEALEDEAHDRIGTADCCESERQFMRGQKYTAKSLRRHLADLTRAKLESNNGARP
jgi:hypothetical protein